MRVTLNTLLGYSIGAFFSLGMFFYGRYCLVHPEKISRFLFWAPGKWLYRYSRFVGRFFLIMGVCGVVFYLLLIAATVFSPRYRIL
jgi:hypothetical protein